MTANMKLETLKMKDNPQNKQQCDISLSALFGVIKAIFSSGNHLESSTGNHVFGIIDQFNHRSRFGNFMRVKLKFFTDPSN